MMGSHKKFLYSTRLVWTIVKMFRWTTRTIQSRGSTVPTNDQPQNTSNKRTIFAHRSVLEVGKHYRVNERRHATNTDNGQPTAVTCGQREQDSPANSPSSDAESISLGTHLRRELSARQRNTAHISQIARASHNLSGDEESRRPVRGSVCQVEHCENVLERARTEERCEWSLTEKHQDGARRDICGFGRVLATCFVQTAGDGVYDRKA
jgi:hypothetical protein